ncbi:MAG TPA: 2-oxoacid:acceptor oxidoreductase family protein [Halanaerobiales bacterium]|nr:2-oxoacid:acceptor oxidoreductase family protein [Halanaerobiales bacterium]
MEKKDRLNIYMIGVGGQGIGLLSEVLIRAADYADLNVRGVDTHGLAQRGGTVQSHLRVGAGIYSPLIQKGTADIVIALERTEALRGIQNYLKPAGTLIYYNTSWQTLDVRLENTDEVKKEDITRAADKLEAEVIEVYKEDLTDARMQNVVLLAEVFRQDLLPDIKKEDYIKALKDLMQGEKLKTNLKLFNSILA